MLGITARQRELLDFLREQARIGADCPSYEEMQNAVGLASKDGVYRLVLGLEERGYIRRIPGRARSITLTSTSGSYKVTFSEERDRQLQSHAANLQVSPEYVIARAVEVFLERAS